MELLFPSAFLALALAHFVALLIPGPDFFLLVGYAARYRIARQRRIVSRHRSR